MTTTKNKEKKENNLKNIIFHDSYLRAVENEGRKVTLYILLDRFWYKGDPIGILELNKPRGHKCFLSEWSKSQKGELQFFSGEIDYLMIRKKKSRFEIGLRLFDDLGQFHFDFFSYKFWRVTSHPLVNVRNQKRRKPK